MTPTDAERNAARVVRTLRDAGHVAYFAGGCVRDRLLGLVPTDYDVATDAPPQRVRALFRNAQAVGAAFGVILVRLGGDAVEVATFRSDGRYDDGRRPESVTFSTAEADAARRDFSINGLFYDPDTDRVIDYVNGQADLASRTLRAIGDPAARFGEDHLRLLRAVRFAARFDLTIDPATAAAIDAHAHELPRISAERIAEELRRILTAPTRGHGFRLLWRHGLLRAVVEGRRATGNRKPQTEDRSQKTGDTRRETGVGSQESEDSKPQTTPTPVGSGSAPTEPDPTGVGVARASLRSAPVGPALDESRSLLLRLSPGKPVAFPVAWLATLIDLRWQGGGFKHDLLGNLSPADADKLVAVTRITLRPSNDELETMADVAKQAHAVLNTPRADDAMLKRLLARPAATQTRQLLDALAAVGAAVDRIAALRPRLETLAGGEVAPPPLVTGDDLVKAGHTPGRAFKRALDAAYDAQLNGEVTDAAAALALAEKILHSA